MKLATKTYEKSNGRGLRIRALGGLLLASAIAITGCATVSPEEAAKARVSELAAKRWEALIAGDFEKAYTFALPSYRKLHDAAHYRANRQQTPVKWLKAEIKRVDCTPEKCTVTVELESKPMVPFGFRGVINSGIEEVWLFEEKQWWALEKL